jgi:hypothetical protein
MMSAAADQCLSEPAVFGGLKLESCFLFSAEAFFFFPLVP